MIKLSNSKRLVRNIQMLSQLVIQTSVPILSFIKVEVKNNKMRLTSTNLETTIITTTECNSDKEEMFLVPSREFARIMLHTENEVEIRVEKNIIIKDGKSNFTLRPVDANEYPEEPQKDIKNIITVSGEELYKLITSIIFNSAKDDLRPMLNGIDFKIESGVVKVVATDGKRLGLNTQNIKTINTSNKYSFTLPSDTLSFLLHLMDVEKNVSISYDDKFCFFEQDGTTVIATKLQGDYPNILSIIKNLGSEYIEMDKKSTIQSLNKVSVLANKINNLIQWRVNGSVLEMQTANDFGEGHLELDIKNPFNQAYKVGFNYLYMLDILKVMSSNTFHFYYKDDVSPLAVKTDDYPAIYIFMPITIKGEDNEEKIEESR